MQAQSVLQRVTSATGATGPVALYSGRRFGPFTAILFWAEGKQAELPVELNELTLDPMKEDGLVAGLSALWAVAAEGAKKPSNLHLTQTGAVFQGAWE